MNNNSLVLVLLHFEHTISQTKVEGLGLKDECAFNSALVYMGHRHMCELTYGFIGDVGKEMGGSWCVWGMYQIVDVTVGLVKY